MQCGNELIAFERIIVNNQELGVHLLVKAFYVQCNFLRLWAESLNLHMKWHDLFGI